MSHHSSVHNRGFFRLDVQMEGEPLIERKRCSDRDRDRDRDHERSTVDLEAAGAAEYHMEPPRLQNSTACSKIALCTCAMGCCVVIGFVLAAILNTATTGLYFLAYALYYSAELQLSGGVSRVLYFGYMSAAALSLGLMTGTVGLAAAYLFVVSVYAKIRVD